jgi:glyoxylase-like metal-dependent hydrolase (beta-lactamase superfamily II)
MRRAVLTVVLLAINSLPLVVTASQQPPAPKVLDVEKLRDNLYVLKGGGGNTAVFIRSSDVVVVDTKNPGWGQTVLDAIKRLTSLPVSTIINTHAGGDHVSGNVEFPADVEIVAHENTRANMESMSLFKASNGKGMPTRTFKDTMTIGTGNDRIDLYYFGTGHTNGDAWVVFPALRAMDAGDDFGFKNLPRIDTLNHGSAMTFPDALATAVRTVRNVDTVIPGHSTQMMTMNDLRELADFNREFLTSVRDAKKAGRSVDDVVNTWRMPGKYTGFDAVQPDRLKTNVQLIFDEAK